MAGESKITRFAKGEQKAEFIVMPACRRMQNYLRIEFCDNYALRIALFSCFAVKKFRFFSNSFNFFRGNELVFAFFF